MRQCGLPTSISALSISILIERWYERMWEGYLRTHGPARQATQSASLLDDSYKSSGEESFRQGIRTLHVMMRGADYDRERTSIHQGNRYVQAAFVTAGHGDTQSPLSE